MCAAGLSQQSWCCSASPWRRWNPNFGSAPHGMQSTSQHACNVYAEHSGHISQPHTSHAVMLPCEGTVTSAVAHPPSCGPSRLPCQPCLSASQPHEQEDNATSRPPATEPYVPPKGGISRQDGSPPGVQPWRADTNGGDVDIRAYPPQRAPSAGHHEPGGKPHGLLPDHGVSSSRVNEAFRRLRPGTGRETQGPYLRESDFPLEMGGTTKADKTPTPQLRPRGGSWSLLRISLASDHGTTFQASGARPYALTHCHGCLHGQGNGTGKENVSETMPQTSEVHRC